MAKFQPPATQPPPIVGVRAQHVPRARRVSQHSEQQSRTEYATTAAGLSTSASREWSTSPSPAAHQRPPPLRFPSPRSRAHAAPSRLVASYRAARTILGNLIGQLTSADPDNTMVFLESVQFVLSRKGRQMRTRRESD
ncbi:hypothetical protein MSAN_02281700 [Mycena sanguinolenta]|uniref:Uncharacterized protein n=1 Tax=Mycena sanguinolenta TaxID=230812 RepID=A0A8H6XB31_9AGAR|nr:hypothetical protein MSAN_02281700 [Mycena sanguinolenta]